MSPQLEVEAIISMNKLMGDIFNLIYILSKLGIKTAHVDEEHMDTLAYKQYRKSVTYGS